MQSWPLMPEIRFGTMREFFAQLEKVRDQLPVVEQELNYIFTGCYTSQSRIKRANRIGEDRLYEAEALDAIHICTLALIPLGLQYAIVDGFTGMGKVQLALPLSAFRKAVYFIALFALPAAFGARATFYAEPISDILGPIVSIAVYALAIRRILNFPPSPPAGEGKAPLPS